MKNSNNTEFEKMLLSPVQAAHMLGIGRTMLFDLLSTGKLRSITIGRCRRIPREALAEFIAARAA